MKIFNLTDVSTPVLKQRHLEDQTFSVEGADVAPGASIDVPEADREHVKAQLAFLFACGALSVDKAPDGYTAGKQKALEDKYSAIKDTKEAEASAPLTPKSIPAPEVRELPAPPPVPEAIEVPEPSDAALPEDRLPTDVPPARRRGSR